MERISKVFATGRKALIVYLTAGYPGPGHDEEMAHTAIEAGADILELGFPFSDPVADGPVIQEASGEALKAGTTLSSTLELAARIRAEKRTPLVLMGYANPVYHMGYDVFAGRLADAGADGVIIPDLPMEAAEPLRRAMRGRGLALIPMAAPNTSEGRLEEIVRAGDGFLYLVSMAGLTGDDLQRESPWKAVALRAREMGTLPVCVGFGIRTGEDAANAAAVADGVIVGSAVTSVIKEAGSPKKAKEEVRRLVEELAGAIKKG